MTIRKAELRDEGGVAVLYVNGEKYTGDTREMMNRIRLQAGG
jgi:hypothetical protein